MKIEKTDAHHHLWRLGSPNYPVLQAPPVDRFLGNTGGLKHEFGAEQFLPLAASQNVTRSVYVESHFEPPIEETACVEAFADAHGFPHAIVGRVDFTSPGFGHALDVHMRSPLFKGVRTMVNWDADSMVSAATDPDVMARSDWRESYAELGRRGLSAEVMATPAQLPQLAEVAAARPGTNLVVGHAGLPLRRTPAEEDIWHAGMTALAALPHVMVKISGLAMVDHRWTVESIRPIVRELIDLFSPARCMFGSNFPVDGLHGTYDETWDAFDAITAADPPADRTALFRDTARRFYRIA